MRQIIALLFFLSFAMASAQTIVPVNPPIQLNPPEYRGLVAPRWAPDGKRLLVSGQNYRGLYLLSFPEGKIEVLSEELTAGWGARWSHNGKYIAARVAKRENQHGYYQLVIYDVANHQRRALTNWLPFLPGTPYWSSDDNLIYLSTTDQLRLYQVDEKVATAQTKLAYVKNDRLYFYDLQTKIDKPAGGDTKILAIQPAPDKRHLAIEKFDGTLMVIDLYGNDTLDVGIGCQPCWSPDSKYLCYAYALDNGHQYYHADLWIVSLDGKIHFNLTPLTANLEMNPSWSPDGKWIAYEVVNRGVIMAQQLDFK